MSQKKYKQTEKTDLFISDVWDETGFPHWWSTKENLSIKTAGPKMFQKPRNRLKRELILDWKAKECTCVWYSESGLSSASSLDRPKSDTLHDMLSPTRTLRAARSLMKKKKKKNEKFWV